MHSTGCFVSRHFDVNISFQKSEEFNCIETGLSALSDSALQRTKEKFNLLVQL